MAVWRQSEGLGSGVPQDGEWNATAKGTGRRSEPAGKARCHCWGRPEEEGKTTIGISLCTHGLSEGRAPLTQATDGKRQHARATGLWVAGYLLCGLRAVEG